MTATDRPVRRVTQGAYGVLFPCDRRRHRPIVVQVGPGDTLFFREKGVAVASRCRWSRCSPWP